MKISSYCYAITGLGFIPPWSVNAGLVNGQTEILVIDTGGNQLAAQTIYGYASALEQNGELRVINTEHHLDHIGGNSFFREKGIDIYGHYQVRRSDQDLSLTIEEYNQCIPSHVRRERNEARVFLENTYIVNPNIPIDSDTILNLGELEVKVILTPGHTATNISVYVPSDGVLFCGDCVLS